MPAPAISQAILTGALIVVIFTVQVFYFYVVDNVWAEMIRRELKEITDYVADTIANLYFLANSTSSNPSLEKTLKIPLDVGGSSINLEITKDQNNYAQTVKGSLQGKTWLNTNSWLPRGLLLDTGKTAVIQSSARTVIAGCQRVSSKIYVWIAYKV